MNLSHFDCVNDTHLKKQKEWLEKKKWYFRNPPSIITNAAFFLLDAKEHNDELIIPIWGGFLNANIAKFRFLLGPVKFSPFMLISVFGFSSSGDLDVVCHWIIDYKTRELLMEGNDYKNLMFRFCAWGATPTHSFVAIYNKKLIFHWEIYKELTIKSMRPLLFLELFLKNISNKDHKRLLVRTFLRNIFYRQSLNEILLL